MIDANVSLSELETSWSYEDIMRANAVLDMHDDIKTASAEIKDGE